MAHRIGILGLGIMGERMLRNMRDHPAFAVAAAWDPAGAALDKLSQLLPTARAASDAAALVADPAVDCVYIAAPPASHLGHAHLAFDHGKAVFCEKPLATNLAAARAAVERVERERRMAAINFPYGSAPAVRAIASGLKSRELGPIEQVEIEVAFARWPRLWQDGAQWLTLRREGGFVREVLSHFVFLMQRLFGPLRLREAHIDYPADGRSAETAIAARLEAGAVPVTLSGRVGGDVPDFNRCVIRGRNGGFELHDWYSLRRRINGSWLDIDFGEGATDRERSYRAQLDALDAMLAGRPHALPSFREGLVVQECIEAMLSGE
ncbi:MAG TPA: Gfo/Idh/MocA family oxidoreductase [Stellaceae bacterium]|nr:Gfo/Idh/MocA family oxidoreductase [Stellaceae bacterium]